MTIKIGDGCTEYVGSDRYPYSVVEVVTARKVVIQKDFFEIIEGSIAEDRQIYEFKPNPHGQKFAISLRKDGFWRRVGTRNQSYYYHVGKRSARRDPCK